MKGSRNESGGSSLFERTDADPDAKAGRLLPIAFELSSAMVEDDAGAQEIAERAVARVLATPRRAPERVDGLTRRAVVKLVRRRAVLSRRTASSEDGTRRALGELSPARRAAVILHARGASVEEIAEVVDRSIGGAQALIDRGRLTMGESLGLHGGDLDSAIHRSLQPGGGRSGSPVDTRVLARTVRRRRAMIAMSLLAALALAGWGFIALPDRETPAPPDPAEPRNVQGEGFRDARATLAGFGAPGWCPDLAKTTPLEGAGDVDGAADVALRFDISLASGYERTVEALRWPAAGAPEPEDWPHHAAPSGLLVVQISPGEHDPDLVRSCGRAAAERSVKAVVVDRSDEPVAIGMYSIRTSKGWRIWGSSGPPVEG